MTAIEFIRAFYISTAFFFLFLVLCWGTILFYLGSNRQKILRAEGNSPMQIAAFVLTVAMIFYLGLRPVDYEFWDMVPYAINYLLYDVGSPYAPISLKHEWVWSNINILCRNWGLNENEFFLVIEFLYLGCMFICCLMLTRKNLWIAMLFFFISFQTYSYGTNGVRNGLACSIELVALCLLPERGFKRFLAFALMFLTLGIHRSTMIPSTAALISLFFIRTTKMAIRFWLVSIALSLVAGPFVERVFVALGFDDRMENYYMGQFSQSTASVFSHIGFRWDFLLYSAAPVLMIWYTTRYRLFSHKMYTMFANTYLISNAFWIYVIRAAYSNRFAYLSWFIYPIVIMFPLLRMNLWKDQDRKTAIILFLYSGFSFFMFFIYYFGTSGFRGFDQFWWE